MSKAKVSIVVPIYNVEEYLPKCLDSLLEQTFKDIEIWAISDGSPDNSADIIKKYAKKDNRVKCIEKENGGYGSVLEYAIKNIKTDYFLVCDPDDWLRKDAIEVLYNAAEKNKLDIVYGGYYFVYSNNNEEVYTNGCSYKNIFVPQSNKVYTGKDIFKFSFLTPSPHAKLFRTKITKKIEFPHKVSFTDWILYNMSLMNCKRIMHLDEGLAYYLIDREGNSVTDVKPKIADYHYQVFKSIVKQYENLDVEMDEFYYRMFLHYIFINSEVAKIKSKDDYMEKKKLVYELLEICVSHKKQIVPYLKNHSFRKRVAFRMLLNPLTSKMMFNYFSRKLFNNK